MTKQLTFRHLLSVLLVLLTLGDLTTARKITVTNSCSGTVWPAYNGLNSGAITVNEQKGTGGWIQAPGQSDVLDVPENWQSARIWPRTGCQEDGTGCIVGDCGGPCDGNKAGASGATLAEFSLEPRTYETFDISIVDGFNVPMRIEPIGGEGECDIAECGVVKDILTVCDPSLAYPQNGDTIWSCLAPCTAKVQFTQGAVFPFNDQTAPVCCPQNLPEACPTNTIPFYDVYKPLCNRAFVYAPDPNGNVHCSGPSEYIIEFCPGGVGAGANPKGIKPVPQDAGGVITGGGGTGTNNAGPGEGVTPYQATAIDTTQNTPPPPPLPPPAAAQPQPVSDTSKDQPSDTIEVPTNTLNPPANDPNEPAPAPIITNPFIAADPSSIINAPATSPAANPVASAPVVQGGGEAPASESETCRGRGCWRDRFGN